MPRGAVPQVSDEYKASPTWTRTPLLPWWKDPSTFVGRITKKERPLRIKNMLTNFEARFTVFSYPNKIFNNTDETSSKPVLGSLTTEPVHFLFVKRNRNIISKMVSYWIYKDTLKKSVTSPPEKKCFWVLLCFQILIEWYVYIKKTFHIVKFFLYVRPSHE